MKTLQELYNEIKASDELKKDFVEAMKSDSVREFLEEKAAEASPLELSPEQLSRVAGGSVGATQNCGHEHTWKCSDTRVNNCC